MKVNSISEFKDMIKQQFNKPSKIGNLENIDFQNKKMKRRTHFQSKSDFKNDQPKIGEILLNNDIELLLRLERDLTEDIEITLEDYELIKNSLINDYLNNGDININKFISTNFP